ncbi:CPBP family intramembrane glutamic endopeptidase [Bacillus rubiinfantis]|uniref:CPBP family intramembrane glutamic endopeptidase n=1 Tax=Bacillus rubiinfantis TaxID=1499680 RepID=UPI0005A9427F|nr:CPBP family intramembrane glutamic endopeptidase [Bacillus rubiinfantis]
MKNKYNELIASLTNRELIVHLYLTQFLLLIISVILGWLLFRDFSYFDYFQISDKNVLLIGVPAGLVIVFLDVILMNYLPSSFYDDGGLNERIFKHRSIFHIIIIAAVVAFCEELLFRGIIQAKLGLFWASIIFAMVHYRYLFNWYLFLNIVTLSFVIGLLFHWTGNFAVTFMMHFLIDFLLGIYMKFRYSSLVDNEPDE